MSTVRIWKGIVTLTTAFYLLSGLVVYAQSDVEKRAAAFKSGHDDKVTSEHAAADHGAPPAKDEHVVAPKKVKHAAKPHAPDAAASHSDDHGSGITAEESLEKLLQGNKRYVAGKSLHPNNSAKRRTQVATGQHPFAIIVSCSDSRVPPEVLFDQGLGDLFVIRSAGHVVDDFALGSIEYAVEHLGSKLIVVLGHERCGAVDATVKGGEAPGHVKNVVEAIRPAVAKARGKHGDVLCNAVKSNVKMTAEKIRGSGPILAEPIGDGLLKIVGAYYDLDSGAVEMTYKP